MTKTRKWNLIHNDMYYNSIKWNKTLIIFVHTTNFKYINHGSTDVHSRDYRQRMTYRELLQLFPVKLIHKTVV